MRTPRPHQATPPSLAVLCGVAIAERLFIWHWYFPFLLYFLFEAALAPGTIEHVRGIEFVQAALHNVYGALDSTAFSKKVFGLYNALTFGLMLVGGVVADRALGHRSSILAGLLLLAAGYGVLVQPVWLFAGLPLLALGFGLFRGSVAPMIAAGFERGAPERENAFYLYFLAIQLGHFFSFLLCEWLADGLGWPVALGTACATSAVAATVWYIATRNSSHSQKPATAPHEPGAWLLPLIGLTLATMLFMGLECRQADLGILWLENRVDRRIFPFSDFQVPSDWLQQLPLNTPTLLIGLPFLLWRWHWRPGASGFPLASRRMALGYLLLGLGLLALAGVPLQLARGGLASGWFFVVSTVTLTVGELFFLPPILAAVTRHAPIGWQATAVAAWLFGRDFLCDYVALFLGRMAAGIPTELELVLLFGLCACVALALWRGGARFDVRPTPTL